VRLGAPFLSASLSVDGYKPRLGLIIK
jgi:hypothetical protein